MRKSICVAIVFLILALPVIVAKTAISLEMPHPVDRPIMLPAEMEPPDAPQTNVFAALGANNAFTGNNSHSGSETFLGAINFPFTGTQCLEEVSGAVGVTGSPCPPNAVSLATDNTWTNNNRFIGADPWFDVTAFGARDGGFPAFNTTASCNGTTTLTLASASSFQNGDGIVVNGCGATNGLATPSTPTVTPGISKTLTVPDAVLVAGSGALGSTTYNYKVFGIDKKGGTTVAGTVGTTTAGAATLGMSGAVTVTSASLSGTTLTLTLPSTNNLAANMLIHFTKSNNAILSGWYTISSVSGGGATLVINNTPIQSGAAAITSTGGNIAYAIGNQITWAAKANTWEYGICRAVGAGSYSLIGLSYPSNGAAYGSSTTFTDWGTTITTKPNLPNYLSDSNCTAGANTNDYLSTTIVSGAGTTSIVVVNSASQTISGQTATFDDEPAFLAAATAAHAAIGGVVYIPPTGFYEINSRLDLTSLSLGVSFNQTGLIYATETIVTRGHWYGTNGAQSLNSFQAASTPQIQCQGAWPCFYDPYEVPFIQNLTFNAASTDNQALILEFDGNAGPIQGGNIANINCNTGATSDYSGVCVLLRPGPYNFNMNNISLGSGPSNLTSAIDTTWTPLLYFMGDSTTSPYSAVEYHLRDVQLSARTMDIVTVVGTTGQNDEISHVYAQGPLLPVLTMQNPAGSLPGINLRAADWTTDTSYVPSINLLGALSLNLDANNIGVPSVETSGVPGWISGRNIATGNFVSTPTASAGSYLNSVSLTGGVWQSSAILAAANKSFVTSDFTDSTSTTLQLITGLSFTLATSYAQNLSFHCSLLFDQGTGAVSDSFGVGVTGTAPTNINASGTVFTAAAVSQTGTLTGLASTTPTAVVTFTPSATTTIFKAELDGTVEQPSNTTPGVFGIYAATTTGTDNLIVKRGSYCSLF